MQWRREKELCLGCGGEGHFLAHCPSKKVKDPTGLVKSMGKTQSFTPRSKPKAPPTKKNTRVLLAPAVAPTTDLSSEGSEEDSQTPEPQAGNEDDLL